MLSEVVSLKFYVDVDYVLEREIIIDGVLDTSIATPKQASLRPDSLSPDSPYFSPEDGTIVPYCERLPFVRPIGNGVSRVSPYGENYYQMLHTFVGGNFSSFTISGDNILS